MSYRLPGSRANLYLSLFSIAIALFLALIWVPMDSGSGLLLKVRRQISIGDALAPTIAAVTIGIGGLLVFMQRKEDGQQALSVHNAAFLVRFLGIMALSFALMRWAGPAVVWVVDLVVDDVLTYRTLRATAPWKYIGFFTGGTAMIAALIAGSEGGLRLRTVFIAMLATAVLIALYDLPFDDLVLPPNGDV